MHARSRRQGRGR